MYSSFPFNRKYALPILAGILLTAACSSCSKKQLDHPVATEGTPSAVQHGGDSPDLTKATAAAVKSVAAVLEKSLAALPPPPSAPAVCEAELTKVREFVKSPPGTPDSANANVALLRCTSKATNEAQCKGKPQPCGVVYFNPPIKLFDPGHPPNTPSEANAVDVSIPDQIKSACREIAGAGDAAGFSNSATADPATGVILNSMIGKYSCAAWLKAAAHNDPTLLIALTFAPAVPLLRDLKTYTNGAVDVTPEAVLAESIKRVDRTLVIVRMGGTFVPLAVLPVVPAGATPAQVLDAAHATVQHRVNEVAKAVEDRCKAAGLCHE